MRSCGVSRRTAVFAVCGILILAAILFRSPSEPAYQGKTVSEWLGKQRYCSVDGFQPGEPETDPALVAIRQLGAPAAPVCVQYLLNAHEPPHFITLLQEVIRPLRGNGPPADPNVSRWTCAAAALLYLGPKNGGGVEKVINAILVAPVARPAAANAFFLIGTNEPTILPALIAGLGDRRPLARQFCAEAIARMSLWAAAALPTLTNLVNDSNIVVRNYSIAALGTVGKDNPEVMQLLQNVMATTTNSDVLANTGRILQHLQQPSQ
ncbi:MAG: hypothetical protein JWM99_1708 [Verrucomicrobiales bacterium]|nr:hypothetical protein [Verrucomicrobiales bacterium]